MTLAVDQPVFAKRRRSIKLSVVRLVPDSDWVEVRFPDGHVGSFKESDLTPIRSRAQELQEQRAKDARIAELESMIAPFDQDGDGRPGGKRKKATKNAAKKG